MLLLDCFNNPSGNGSMSKDISSAKAGFDKKYEGFKTAMSANVYEVKDKYYIHVKVPSSVDSIFYDMVLETKIPTNGKTILHTDGFKLFSNSPSFAFSYANMYAEKRIFITDLRHKLTRAMVKKAATSRNPNNVLSYDYTIYCGLKYIIDNNLVSNESLSSVAKKVSKYEFTKEVSSFDELQKNRRVQKDYNKFLKEESDKNSKESINERYEKHRGERKGLLKSIKGIMSSSKTKNVKSTKSIKRK